MPPYSRHYNAYAYDEDDTYSFVCVVPGAATTTTTTTTATPPTARSSTTVTVPAPCGESSATSTDSNTRKQQQQQEQQETESSPPKQQRQGTPRKNGPKVSFCDRVEVVDIARVCDEFSSAEIKQMWYTRWEFEIIRQECAVLVEMINNGQSHRVECSRGLERHTAPYRQNSKMVQYKANEAVFGLQKVESCKGLSLSELMADMYRSNTLPAKQEAQQRAITDAVTAGIKSR